MSTRKTHDVIATVGSYEDRKTGQKRERWVTCGAAFTSDKGRISIKLDALPCSPDWSGFLSLKPVDDQPRNRGHRPEDDNTPF